ncbi:hypothetical protein FF38_01978 [Lucilia cuprina]|uniref:Uncharacterized protein n=1 Tax=Lucilia cuprina TaxID=7375 RepID=A0A0L0CR04_LUCCU|nr:hypothetical protein FF38_01978 [Lucilia cuprina]
MTLAFQTQLEIKNIWTRYNFKPITSNLEPTIGDCYNHHNAGDQCGIVICSNCKGSDATTDRNCPDRAKAFTVKKLMTIENHSIKEARMRFSNAFSNRFLILDDYEDELPALNPSCRKS